MNKKYSIFNLIKNSFSYHENWQKAWQSPKLKDHYDVIIIGGGGHGLASAYYLAKNHNVKNIAVIEKGYLGGGNTARNTTIIRSNYLYDESSKLYDLSLDLWEGLSQDLNFNIMLSQRGVLNLGHTLQCMRDIERRVNANRLNGIDGEILSAKEVKKICPIINDSPDSRYPVIGASYQKRGGVARHDAVAWGYARAASNLGVDIIQNCEVTDFAISHNQVEGVKTTQGLIKAKKVAICVAGNSSHLAKKAKIDLPVESKPLQAFVSEPIKPIIHNVVMSNHVHAYVSQSDKGDIVVGAGVDSYNGYGQRGSPHVIEHSLAAVLELFPMFSRLKMNRQWGGIVDVCPDACPIVGLSPVKNLFLNCGWGTGGFKATPGSGYVFAHTIANNKPHEINKPFSLDRFSNGDLIDEHGAAGVAH